MPLCPTGITPKFSRGGSGCIGDLRHVLWHSSWEIAVNSVNTSSNRSISLSLSFVSVCLHGCLYDLIIAMCLRQFWIFIKLSSVCRHVICINLSNQMSWVSLCFTHDSWQLWRQCLVPFAMLPNGTSLQLIVDRIRTHQASDSKRFLARQTDLVG